MTDLLTTAKMRALEQTAIERGKVTGLELMERAGRGVITAIFEQWPELTGRGASPSRSPGYLTKVEECFLVVVLCGPGNNGGDGFVVARLLHENGWEVEVFLYGDAKKLPPDARVNYARWQEFGMVRALGSPQDLEGFSRLMRARAPNLFVDAFFGIGLTRPLPGIVQAIVRKDLISRGFGRRSGNAARVVAIDIPSGLDADAGQVVGAENDCAVFADLTVTFHGEKTAHRKKPGPEHCGRVVVADIGLSTL